MNTQEIDKGRRLVGSFDTPNYRVFFDNWQAVKAVDAELG